MTNKLSTPRVVNFDMSDHTSIPIELKGKQILDVFSYNSKCKKYHFVIYKTTQHKYYQHTFKLWGGSIYFESIDHATFLEHHECLIDQMVLDYGFEDERDLSYDERDFDLISAEYDGDEI
jgi:hypothetical protein